MAGGFNASASPFYIKILERRGINEIKMLIKFIKNYH
nr:MAG TPA: hypothetical protein [Caudoviricetes sp.]